jgi:hypothetical protein
MHDKEDTSEGRKPNGKFLLVLCNPEVFIITSPSNQEYLPRPKPNKGGVDE